MNTNNFLFRQGRRVNLILAAAALGVFAVGCSTSPSLKSTTIYRVGGDSEKLGCNNCPFVAKTAGPQLSKRTADDGFSSDQPKWCAVTGQVEYPPRRGKLTNQEMKMARVAWKYFENNFNPSTGLVNAVNAYPSTTLWDTASYLAGMVAARELGIIDKDIMDQRLLPLIRTFNNMDLFRDEMPNKAYNTKTGAKVNYSNKPGEIGYSALDIGRLLIWFSIIKERYPEHATGLDNALLKWNWCNIVNDEGTLYGAAINKKSKETRYLQEGRLGYEEYAAKGFQLWGFKTTLASKKEPFDILPIYGIPIAYDSRDPRVLKAHNYVVNESYVLDAVELGWDQANDFSSDADDYTDPTTAELGHRVYAAQEARYCETGILTARTEHQLDKAPYFVYDTIYTDGYAWNTITESGENVPEFSAVALKGALGMWAVWDSPYTDLLFDAIAGLYDPEKGFYEGLYENGDGLIKTFTANNNGIMLEALLYKAQGKLLRKGVGRGPWEKALENPFRRAKQCLPVFECTTEECVNRSS